MRGSKVNKRKMGVNVAAFRKNRLMGEILSLNLSVVFYCNQNIKKKQDLSERVDFFYQKEYNNAYRNNNSETADRRIFQLEENRIREEFVCLAK